MPPVLQGELFKQGKDSWSAFNLRWVELHPPGPWHGPEAPHEAREANGVGRASFGGMEGENAREEGKAPRRDKPRRICSQKTCDRRKERRRKAHGVPPRTPAAESMVPPDDEGGHVTSMVGRD